MSQQNALTSTDENPTSSSRNEHARPVDQTHHIAAATCKLPPFYTSNARFWFIHAEQEFVIKNITADDTKFGHIVASIQEDVAFTVMSAIESPPPGNKYENLKKELLRQFTLSSAEMAESLLTLPGLGDLRPSHLLQKILSLHPKEDKPNFLTRAIFLRQLPEEIRNHLVDKTELELTKLAAEADKFYVALGQRVHAVTQPPSEQPTPPTDVQAVHDGPDRTHNNNRGNNRQQFVKQRPAEVLCYFHRRFGKAAMKCRSPCSFAQGN